MPEVGIKNTPYHPQANSSIERLHGTLVQMIRKVRRESKCNQRKDIKNAEKTRKESKVSYDRRVKSRDFQLGQMVLTRLPGLYGKLECHGRVPLKS